MANPPKRPAFPISSALPLSSEQKSILEMVKSGESVFFTGSAGTGKSHLLKRIIKSLPPDTTFPTASTGAAACLIGGTTLHAFAGMGTGSGTLEACIAMASRDTHASTWRKCRCLVVDEVSMVDADFFDKMEGVARALRKSKAVFGGIQLVVCGDFLQLPPITKDSENKPFCFQVRVGYTEHVHHGFCVYLQLCIFLSPSTFHRSPPPSLLPTSPLFPGPLPLSPPPQAKCWHTAITRSVELTEIYRQNDMKFIALLQNIRIGRCPQAVADILTSTRHQVIESGGIRATRLYTHKGDVEATNSRELQALGGPVREFLAQDSDPQMEKTLDVMCPVGRAVELKVGAQVRI